jgi:hypothetical protein
MNTFKICAAQGDIYIRCINTIPASAKKSDATGGQHILAHSETGHHHTVCSRAADRFIDSANEFIAYLNVTSETEIKHLRDFDTHEPLMLTPGNYEVRQQREYVAEGFRRAQD